MKPILTITIGMIMSICHAQQIPLTGQVSKLNSGYRTGVIEYIEHAAVESTYAGATSSDAEGKFKLTFSGIDAGTSVSLTVEKAGLEVVNEYDLLHVDLGRRQPLRVFVAAKGELAQRQTEFYDVSLAALTAKHDALIASLRAGGQESANTLQELAQQLNREIANRYEAEDIIRERLEKAKERLPEMAKRLAEVNLDFASATYRNAYEAYLRGDIQAALNILNEEELSSKTEEIFTSLEKIERGQQDYQLALEIEMDKASQVYESYALKADAYGLIFDYKNAAIVLQKGVGLLNSVKEEEDLELADAYGALGRVLHNSGEYNESLVFKLKSTEIKEQILPANDWYLAISYSSLAQIYQDLGRYKQALATQQKALAIMQQVLEPNYSSIAISYTCLALTYQDLGQFEQALAAQRKALAIQDQVLEPNHPDIATSYNILARIYVSLGLYRQALSVQQVALTIREQVLEPNHPDIATSYNNLAAIYRHLGYYEQALIAQQQALTIQKKVLGSNHPSIATSYNNVALIYKELGNYTQALSNQQQALVIQKQVLDSNHPDIATSYNNLAEIYTGLGYYEQALAAQEKDITIREQILDANHPSIATSYNNLAAIYRHLGYYEQALAAQEKDIAIKKLVYEPNHPLIATSYNNLAVLYRYWGNYEKALTAQQQALTIRKQVYESSHPDIANSYHNLGSIFYNQGELDSAIVYEEKAYNIWKQILPQNHPNLQLVKNIFTVIYTERAAKHRADRQYQNAIKDYQYALEYSEEKAKIYNHLGITYYFLKQYELAIKYYEYSYQQNGINRAGYLHFTGMAYAKFGQLENARERFIEVEKLMPQTGGLFMGWGIYYAVTGNHEIALDNLEKAIQLGYNNWEFLRAEEALDPLRDHPRFKALLEQASTQKE